MQYILCITTILIFSSCENLQQSDSNSSDIIAEAFGEKLSLKDLSAYLKDARTESDSQFIISRYSDQWVMDKILFEEAKDAVGENKRINDLVDDYKKSLIIHEWDKVLLNETLDTVISENDIKTFYDESKKEFKLQEDIVRVLYVKIPESSNSKIFKDLWKTEDLPAIKQFVNQSNGFGFLDTEKWYYKSDLKNLIPSALFKKIGFSKPNNYSHTDAESKFFVKIIEMADADNDAPVSFVEEIIKERILHDRAKEILKNKKNALYQKNIQNKLIKVYSKSDN